MKITEKDIIANYLTASVTVIEGCTCPDSKPWYDCMCPEAQTLKYDCLCHNLEDVLDGSNTPSDTPTIEAVASLIKAHPKARFVYMGCKTFWDPKWGSGNHFSLAQKAAKTL